MSQANPDYVPANVQTPLAWHYTSGKAADESDTVAAFPGVLDINDVLGSNGTYLPPPGMVGEIVYASRLPAQALQLTNGQPSNLVVITLTPGDWDAWAVVCYERRNLPTATDYWMASLTPVSGSQIMYPDQTTVTASGGNSLPLNGVPGIASMGPSIITTTIALPLYLNASCGFTSGNAFAYGNVYARRRR